MIPLFAEKPHIIMNFSTLMLHTDVHQPSTHAYSAYYFDNSGTKVVLTVINDNYDTGIFQSL